MKKHAILIMVHKNNYVLEKNLELLDSPFLDIYIHVDKKCHDFKFDYYKEKVKKANLIYVNPRIDVRWGDFSQISCELLLMESAYKERKYKYYHLISGEDLMVMPLSSIFANCENQVYLDSSFINPKTHEGRKIYQRISVKHVLIKYIRSNNFAIQYGARILNKAYAEIQSALGRDLIKKKNINLRYGSNWFSLPGDVVKYILNSKSLINDYFSKGWLVDELFIQTIIADNKEITERLYDNNKRKIKWLTGKQAHPYVWRKSDFKEIIQSNKFFARKFDENVDRNIIDMIFDYLRNLDKHKKWY